jgi:competence protein ComEA
MDDDFETHRWPQALRDRLGDWVRPTPAETAGLVLLLTGALAATGLVVWQASQRPTPPPPAAAAIHGTHDEGGHLDAGPSVEDAHGHHAGHGHGQPGVADVAAGPVVVHVTGAVGRPGVVELPDGGRVADAIDAAGGALADAALDRLNLARPLTDGEHVHLPRPDEEPRGEAAGGGPGAGTDEAVDADGRVDLNRADAEQLQTLPGIGPSKAQAIIRHRQEHGPFAVPGDVRAVPGVGEKTFQQLAELITAS